MSSWLWTPLTQRVSSVYNRNTVDSPSGDPEIEPELANETVETTGGRGATCTTRFDNRLNVQHGCETGSDNRLNEQWLFVQHGCQTGMKTGLTTVLLFVTGCHTGLTTGLTTGWMFVYTLPTYCLFISQWTHAQLSRN